MNGKETQLQQMLTQLRTKLLVMAAAVGISLDEAYEALRSGNVGRAGAVVDGDADINAMETEIDAMALSLLARNQPVAHDLRFVVAALRMVIDLERIGDEAVSIAERTIILQELLPAPVDKAVNELMDTARALYKQAVDAFRQGDAGAALTLARNDEETTQTEVEALRRIMDHFYGGPESCNGREQPYAAMHGILICRALNRICRRAANIAEHTYFITQGVNIKHMPQ